VLLTVYEVAITISRLPGKLSDPNLHKSFDLENIWPWPISTQAFALPHFVHITLSSTKMQDMKMMKMPGDR